LQNEIGADEACTAGDQDTIWTQALLLYPEKPNRNGCFLFTAWQGRLAVKTKVVS
jgi:hypothetical protein